MELHPPQLPDAPARPSPEPMGARPGTRRSSRPADRARRAAMLAVLGILTVLVLIAGFVAWEVRRFAQIPRVDVAAVQPPTGGGAANWLLVGTDSRDGISPDEPNAGAFLGEVVTGTRTDTIVVVRADGASGAVDVLSIPRDLWVPIDGVGTGRINGAYNGGRDGGGGPQRLVATVEANLGIEINHYAEVDFVGFRDVVDALGGITVEFPNPTRDVRSGLVVDTPGPNVLDGEQALALARSRTYEELVDGAWRVDPTGDIGRTERQRLLLARIVDAAGSAIGPTGVLTVDRVLAAGADSMVLDRGTSLSAVLDLVRTTAAVGADGVTSHALPVSDHVTGGGAQVLVLRDAEAGAVLDRFRTSTG